VPLEFIYRARACATGKPCAPQRSREITQGLLNGMWFACHNTIESDDEDEFETVASGTLRNCAGAIEYEDQQGLSSNYRRMCERLDVRRR
jgi:hypothetical protein